MSYLVQNVAGKGIGLANTSSIYINQSGATTAIGETLALAEIVAEGPGSLVPNSHGDLGTLAHVVLPAVTTGLIGSAGSLPFYLLATEVAAVGAPVRCFLEAYYVDGIVNATTPITRAALYYNDSRQLETPANGIGYPAVARYVGLTGATVSAATPVKIHFRGFPGGFGVGAGA